MDRAVLSILIKFRLIIRDNYFYALNLMKLKSKLRKRVSCLIKSEIVNHLLKSKVLEFKIM